MTSNKNFRSMSSTMVRYKVIAMGVINRIKMEFQSKKLRVQFVRLIIYLDFEINE
jgi:hypothetical protein